MATVSAKSFSLIGNIERFVALTQYLVVAALSWLLAYGLCEYLSFGSVGVSAPLNTLLLGLAAFHFVVLWSALRQRRLQWILASAMICTLVVAKFWFWSQAYIVDAWTKTAVIIATSSCESPRWSYKKGDVVVCYKYDAYPFMRFLVQSSQGDMPPTSSQFDEVDGCPIVRSLHMLRNIHYIETACKV